ncbi:DUF973 family protein [Thermogladius sp. 4427co]|uniref:DUF973 family protein n=1 Tax=Thermogladius sp. 4427co TaxID=3450718 RepID=UPI003F79817F
MATNDQVLEAYRDMREGSLYLIIAWLLIGIGLIAFAASLIGFLAGGFAIGRHTGLASLVGLAVLVIVGGLIALIGLWGKFVPGVKKLASANPEYGTAASLVNIGLFWGIVLLLVGALLLVVLVGAFIILIGAILLILGYIGLLILGLKLYETEKNVLYLVAGILFILAIFASILGFIGWILLYVALGDSISKRMRAPPAPPAPTTPTTLPPPV